MCDYSLLSVPNRLAREGEQLVVHRFSSGSLGLVASEPDAQPPSLGEGWWPRVKRWLSAEIHPCAVCIPPGAQLILRDIPATLQREYRLNAKEEVTFTQLSADAYRYRDAVRFSSGKELLLQYLVPGQHVHVLSLNLPDVDARPTPTPEHMFV